MEDWFDLFFVYHMGSGHAFFLGVALLLTGVGMSLFSVGRAGRLIRNVLVLCGAIFVTISAVPLPEWLYVILAGITLAWLVSEWFWSYAVRWIRAARYAMLIAWLVAVALELPYHFMPWVPPPSMLTLFVIGDSVSAGTRAEETGTWPKLLAKEHNIQVHDFSQMGATVGSARKQATCIDNGEGMVLLEIGGNDVLGTTTAEQFEDRLDQLLKDVRGKGHTVVMLELPLPPFANRFGLIQRRLASKYGVHLVPKRAFITILTTPGATMDGIHLTPQGHALMAEMIWEQVFHSNF
jgi:acyl-CoA thioesterase I